MTVQKIELAEAHRRMRDQGVSHERHYAFKCPMCGTVQSASSLISAGVKLQDVDRFIGFSCEGRFTNAGPWSETDAERRKVRGCDWTLGGMFRIHKLEVEFPDGKTRPCFEIASPDEAKALEALSPTDPRGSR